MSVGTVIDPMFHIFVNSVLWYGSCSKAKRCSQRWRPSLRDGPLLDMKTDQDQLNFTMQSHDLYSPQEISTFLNPLNPLIPSQNNFSSLQTMLCVKGSL